MTSQDPTPPSGAEVIARERERWLSDPEDNAYWEEMHARLERGDPQHAELSRAAAEHILGSLRPGERLEYRPGEGLFVVRNDQEDSEDDAGSEPEDQ